MDVVLQVDTMDDVLRYAIKRHNVCTNFYVIKLK